MGSFLFQFPNPFPVPIYQNHPRSLLNQFTVIIQPCFSGGSRCDWLTKASPNKRSRFSDAYVTYNYNEEDEFEFRRGTAQRIWWLGDFDDDDNDDDEEFGFVQGAVALNWISKVFQAFGWMIPAVIISLVMGNGPNTIIMTLALPLAQSLFSLAADTLWGKPVETSRPKPRRKKRPFARASSGTRARKGRRPTQTANETGDYKSWVAGNNFSAKNDKSAQNFGGWDELDNVVKVDKEPREKFDIRANEAVTEERFKISRRTEGDTPLLVRLFIATFPFLGVWTKFL